MIERPERTKLARQWLAKAEEDLIAARHLLTLAEAGEAVEAAETVDRAARARLETVGPP